MSPSRKAKALANSLAGDAVLGSFPASLHLMLNQAVCERVAETQEPGFLGFWASYGSHCL
jgi:hypothetical protein